MNPSDFVFDQVYKGAIKLGVKEFIAKNFAIEAMDKFKKNKFAAKKADLLIKESIIAAKKQSKSVN
jgi:hypothetical protein